ncbi:hypothetical protein OEZ60_22070 [Defluviimonas sp. WL0024]|uniref:Uncharacterized protein n=1 Tax=Albidovulum salinarum TaxID=2984153 RepID=A0ABT2XC84_9RHOB|nr:hypothetical protein [Defluviimonas sp. WL0024]MCU9850657.1 hypothetical protein [Defluviimonas sp. WL0024]
MSVRGLLGRVQRLETAWLPRPSPIVRAYGSFANFEAQCREEMAAGALDKDFPIEALAQWEADGTWQVVR